MSSFNWYFLPVHENCSACIERQLDLPCSCRVAKLPEDDKTDPAEVERVRIVNSAGCEVEECQFPFTVNISRQFKAGWHRNTTTWNWNDFTDHRPLDPEDPDPPPLHPWWRVHPQPQPPRQLHLVFGQGAQALQGLQLLRVFQCGEGTGGGGDLLGESRRE